MKNIMYMVIALSCAAVHSEEISTAESTTNETKKDFYNGCGSGWNEKLVPEEISIFPSKINLEKACRVHDNCYSKCLEGGDYSKTEICKEQEDEARSARRSKCDDEFSMQMKEMCRELNKGKIAEAICKFVGNVYLTGISIGGGSFFDGKVLPKEFVDFLKKGEVNEDMLNRLSSDLEQLGSSKRIVDYNVATISMINGQPKLIVTARDNVAIDTNEVLAENYVLRQTTFGTADITKAVIGHGGAFKFVTRDNIGASLRAKVIQQRSQAIP
ncbi:hypothetical protein GCM10007907_20660 [Chitinimonas prasina]|uniref:Uncharacterized protein n=1 Tax=Chitinimonas prasina TaxID=1434937 RepID=A0ABQ5YJ22_9NEIS|nr:hypothetical protein [Chitinimonas prasina]GLR13276.1 hypothetical protein GCM10007907_20660 [Chitinimonas prasina]